MTKILAMAKPLAEDSSEHLVFPLPVAVVAKEIHSYKCLVSATAMWHLLPVDEPVGRFFAVDIRTTERWQVWHNQLGVCEGELLAPAKSIAAKKRARQPAARASPAEGTIVPFVAEATSSGEDLEGSPLSFAQYMMTSKVMLGALMWLAHVKKSCRAQADCILRDREEHCILGACRHIPAWCCQLRADGGCQGDQEVASRERPRRFVANESE